MRLVGPAAGKKLIRVTDGILAAPRQDKTKKRLGDELLIAMAASGDPDAVKYILDISRMDRGDETLGTRCLGALYTAYVDPQGLFDLQEPSGLVPNLDQLVAIAKDDRVDPGAANSAVSFIPAGGPPQGPPPPLTMVPPPPPTPRWRRLGAGDAAHVGTAGKGAVRRPPEVALMAAPTRRLPRVFCRDVVRL